MSARLVCTMTVSTLFFDGACAPNPGPGAWGAVLFPGDRASSGTRRYAPLRIREATWAGSGQLGTACTSNVAEYGGLIGGLRGAVASLGNSPPPLIIAGDSEVVLSQLTGRRRTTAPRLVALLTIASGLVLRLGEVTVSRVPRERNVVADTLAAAALRLTPSEVPLLRPCLVTTARLTVGGVTTPATHDFAALGNEDGMCLIDARWLRSLPSDAGGGMSAFSGLRAPRSHVVTVNGRGRRYAILGMLSLDVVVTLGKPSSPAEARALRRQGLLPERVAARVRFAVVDDLPMPAHVAVRDPALKRLEDGGILMGGGPRPVQSVFHPLYAQDPFWLDEAEYLPSCLLLE